MSTADPAATAAQNASAEKDDLRWKLNVSCSMRFIQFNATSAATAASEVLMKSQIPCTGDCRSLTRCQGSTTQLVEGLFRLENVLAKPLSCCWAEKAGSFAAVAPALKNNRKTRFT